MEISFNGIDNSTVSVNGKVLGKGSKKAKAKRQRNYAKLSLHLFDKDYIEKLYMIEIESVKFDRNKQEFLRGLALSAVKVLMK